MRDFVNPLVLLAVVVLLACRAGGVGDVVTLDGWILALTVTAFIVNGALCMARLLARRRALMSVVWSMGYLILGSCAWVLHGMVQQTADEEQAALLVLKQAWQQGESPYQVDESGDSLFTTAASLGKVELVQEVLATGSAPAEQLAEAARRAAENGRVDVLKLLLESGTPVNAIAGSTTLLCAAAQNGQRKAVELLLQSGADANLADADGTPPLIHAVLAESAPVVKLLMQAGADATRTDAQGRSAADYSRSEQMDQLLTSTLILQ